MSEGAHPVARGLAFGAAIGSLVLAAYSGWTGAWMLDVEGADTATAPQRVLVAVLAAIALACFAWAALVLVHLGRLDRGSLGR